MAYGLTQLTRNNDDYLFNDPNIADEFSATTAYTIGQHVYYNGILYCFTANHAAGAWNASHVAEVKVGGELTDLKSALKVEQLITVTLEQGGINSSGLSPGSDSTGNYTIRLRSPSYYYVPYGFNLNVPSGLRVYIYYYTENRWNSYAGNSGGWLSGNILINNPTALYVRFVVSKEDNTALTPSDVTSNIVLIPIGFTDKTLALENKAADAQAVGNILSTTLRYYGALDNNTDLNTVTNHGMYNLLGTNTYLNSPTTNLSNLFVLGSTSQHIQIVVNDYLLGIYYRVRQNGTYGNWRSLPMSIKQLTNSDNLNSLTNTQMVFYSADSIPSNAPRADYSGIVLHFRYDSTYSVQLYTNGRNDFYFRICGSTGYTSWKNLSRPRDILDFTVVKGVWRNDGTRATSNVNGVCCDHIFELTPGSTLDFYLSSGWVYTIREGSSITNLQQTAHLAKNKTHLISNNFVAISFAKYDANGDSINLDVNDFDDSVIIRTSGDALYNELDVHDLPDSVGQFNVLCRAYQMSKINYTTKSHFYLHSGGSAAVTIEDVDANTNLQGVPYSSMRETMASIPQATSFHSFMTMVNNPNSYLYTKHYEQSSPDYYYNSRCYVGAVCSTLVAYCYGIDDVIPTTISFANYPGLNPLPSNQQNPQFLKLGDMLNHAGDHIVIVTDIIRTNRGRIKSIEVTEAWKPLCRSMIYTPDEIVDRYFDNDFVAYRYENIDSVTYSPDPWIHVDETETAEPTYSTVLCPRKGDKSNWKLGETVEIDVMDNTAEYTSYVLTNVATESVISTTNIPSGNVISLTSLAEGRYSVYLTDGTNNCTPVYFDVINASATYTSPASHKVKAVFSSAVNRTPSAIYWCCNKQTSSDYRAVRSFHVLTAAEIVAGEATVDEPTDFRASDSNNGVWKMRMAFKTEFGLFASDLVDVNVTA